MREFVNKPSSDGWGVTVLLSKMANKIGKKPPTLD